jgi:CBS-domain-containing membrane protein
VADPPRGRPPSAAICRARNRRDTSAVRSGSSTRMDSRSKRADNILTPVVFTVKPDTPAAMVVEPMLSLTVHHLFVVDDGGSLVGGISSLDVLRHLHKT